MDADAVAAYAARVWGYKQGEMVSLLIHLGDRLGLYRSLAELGETAAPELAARTGLHERWVLEWLRANAAADLLESDDGVHFQLPAEARPVLVDEGESLAFAAGAFANRFDDSMADDLAEAFRTGIGMPYDRHGPNGAHQTERLLGPWTRSALVPRIIPALDGVAARLESGGKVADVGCGAGVALTALAEAYPASHFDGYDLSEHALARARVRVREAGLDNVTLHHERAEGIPTAGEYDLVLTFDCLHDMTRPADAMAAIRKSIRDDGVWLIKDIRSSSNWADNRKNPMLALAYGFSITSCMSSAMSEPGGAGLGTLGLNSEVAERMVREAGFSRFVRHDFDDPGNLYYEVRV